MAATVVVAGLECAQLLVWSRYTDAGDVVAGAIGAALGALAITAAIDEGRRIHVGVRRVAHRRSCRMDAGASGAALGAI